MAVPKVLIPMADYGHDPTETSVPYTTFKKAGFEVHFVTETGNTPQCDQKLLSGLSQKILGATKNVLTLYSTMSASPEFKTPLSWTSSTFTFASYTLIFLPGGHEKGVRQLLDSPVIQSQVADFFPQCKKPSGKCVAAVCHGVMVLSQTELNGKSVIHDCDTTALPARFEQVAFWGTRVVMGDYYKTYGAGSENVEDAVKSKLDNPAQFKNSLSMSPFVVVDEKYNYISARFPNDAQLLAEKTVAMVKENFAT